MISPFNKPKTDSVALTGALRRFLVGIIIVGCVLAGIQVVAVNRLEREIAIWGWTSDVNDVRARLLDQIKDPDAGEDNLQMIEVLALFHRLDRATQMNFDDADHDEQARKVAKLNAEARTFFLQVQDARINRLPLRKDIKQSVEALVEIITTWAAYVHGQERQTLLYIEQIERRSQQINQTEAALTSVLLQMQVFQQQLMAIERLVQTAPPDVLWSSVAALDTSELPKPCLPEEVETAGRFCSPSVERVTAALETLKKSDVATISSNVILAQRDLQAYVRAGQGRLRAMAAEGNVVLTDMQNAREWLAHKSSLSDLINQIERLIFEIKVELDQPVVSFQDIHDADALFRGHASDIKTLMLKIVADSTGMRRDQADFEVNLRNISENWITLRDVKTARISALDAFTETMDILSFQIASHAGQVRRDTELWVKLYASSFLVLAGAMIASTVGLVLVARSKFIAPLVRVTGTILRLAGGNIDQPVHLPERAFGFDRLGQALEQLRLEMTERQRLAERNLEQQATIEANLAELGQTNDEMAWLAKHDPLTGLANRRQADEDLNALTLQASLTGTDFCVMQIDIDRFKTVNDALGHGAGDFVLKSVSDILNSCCSDEAKCYRTGGDEFLIVRSGSLEAERAGELAANLIKQIEAPLDFNGHRCDVGASIGIAMGGDADFDAMQTVINADLALYQVKAGGRGTFNFFSDELAAVSSRKKDITERLIVALEQKTFQPFYQPQFEASSRRLRGVEVLCRWQDKDLGWISPGEFLPIGQELKAVSKIDALLFDKVADDLATLAGLGLSVPRVSFNITADHLLKSGLARELSSKIGPYAKVSVELLESMSLDNPSQSVRWAIDDLRDNGIDIEVDDFGSDRASLAGLMAINPQAMKIDRSIVIPIVESGRHLDLVKKIIDIGTALNLEVLAEGVETEEHAARLDALGCNALQGFGLARPMPLDDLMAFCNHNPDFAKRRSNATY